MTRDEIAREKDRVNRSFRHVGDGKAVKVRKERRCFNSDRRIDVGSIVYAQKVLPGSSNGRMMDLTKPRTFYFCGTCAECTH